MSKQGEQVRKWGSFLFMLVAVSIMVVISVRSCQKKMTPAVQTVTAVAAEPEATEFLVMTESATNDLAVEIKEEKQTQEEGGEVSSKTASGTEAVVHSDLNVMREQLRNKIQQEKGK